MYKYTYSNMNNGIFILILVRILYFLTSKRVKLSEKYSVSRDILKCDYKRYSPSEISTINTANSQVYINIPREDNVISLLNSYLE